MMISIGSASAFSQPVKAPAPSPTFPERGDREVNGIELMAEDIAQFDSVKMTIQDAFGESLSFIQIKQLDGSYDVFIPRSVYNKVIDQGFDFGNTEVNVLSEKEFMMLSKQVKLSTSANVTAHDYIGGEGGRCAAGTIGAAIAGAMAGVAVGGPAGAVAGAIGGALVGSASNCK